MAWWQLVIRGWEKRYRRHNPHTLFVLITADCCTPLLSIDSVSVGCINKQCVEDIPFPIQLLTKSSPCNNYPVNRKLLRRIKIVNLSKLQESKASRHEKKKIIFWAFTHVGITTIKNAIFHKMGMWR